MSGREAASTGKSVTRKKCILAVTLLALLFNLVVIILGACLMTSLSQLANSQDQSTTSYGSSEKVGTIACVTCDRHGDMLKVLAVKKVNDTARLCCAESTSQMSALLELILRNPEVDDNFSLNTNSLEDPLESLSAGNFSFSKASAHKRLQPKEMFDSSKEIVPVFGDKMVPLTLNDTYHEPSMEHVRGVQVMESGFNITQTGTYHVYSSVRFKPDSSQRCSSFKFKIWQHTVTRTSRQVRQCILKSTHTCCDNCTRDRETSFASGVFLLEAGDQLSVDITALGLISYYHHSSYFGLMMLGNSRT